MYNLLMTRTIYISVIILSLKLVIKLRKKKYHTVIKILKPNIKIVERVKIDTPHTNT